LLESSSPGLQACSSPHIEYFAERIYHLGKTVDWDRILTFLPIFERPDFVFARETTSPSYTISDEKIGFYMEVPFYEWAPEAKEFHKTLYDDRAIFPFDWEDWDQRKWLVEDPSALADADEGTLRKLLTAHSRADRFNEGHFIEMLQ